MDQLIQKTANKIERHKHISGKDVALRFLIPLMRAMHEQYASALSQVDSNFDTIFESLGLGDTGFLDDAFSYVTSSNSFVDRLLVAAGFFEPDPDTEGAYRVSSVMPMDLQNELKQQQSRMVTFLRELESLRLAEEEGEEGEGEFFDSEEEGDVSLEGAAVEEKIEAESEEKIATPEVLPPEVPSSSDPITDPETPATGEAHA